MRFRKNINFLLICLIFCLFLMYARALNRKGKSGPFETRLVSLRRCEKPKPSYHKIAKNISLELYNTTTKTNLVRMSINIESSHSNLMSRAKQYKWVNGKWKLNWVIDSDKCNGPITILFRIAGFNYDAEHCSVLPGKYHINGIDPNALHHTVMTTSEYGKERWKIQVFVKTGTVFCYDFEIQVVPK